jgi:thiol-disulfide isomerase/thioredoxin
LFVNRRRLIPVLVFSILLAAFAGGYLVSLLVRPAQQLPPPVASSFETAATLAELDDISLPSLDDLQPRRLVEWQGKVVVVNFWATWCPPCVKEIPLFVSWQQRHAGKLQFVGIGFDDAAALAGMAERLQMNYPTLLLDEMRVNEVFARLGNDREVLPYTAVFDSRGRFSFSHFGEVDEAVLDEALVPLL